MITDNRSNQDFVDSFEKVTFKCQTIDDIYTKQQFINFGFYTFETYQLVIPKKKNNIIQLGILYTTLSN